MKSTNESNARAEMERIWKDEPTFYELNLERRVKVLEAQVADLRRELERVVYAQRGQHETNS